MPGRMNAVPLVGLLGGLRPTRVDHDELAAAGRAAPRAGPGQSGAVHEAAVRRVRVGAEDQQVVGAVDVGHRHAQPACRTCRPRATCFGIWSTVLAENTFRVPIALGERCGRRASPERLWALGLPR